MACRGSMMVPLVPFTELANEVGLENYAEELGPTQLCIPIASVHKRVGALRVHNYFNGQPRSAA